MCFFFEVFFVIIRKKFNFFLLSKVQVFPLKLILTASNNINTALSIDGIKKNHTRMIDIVTYSDLYIEHVLTNVLLATILEYVLRKRFHCPEQHPRFIWFNMSIINYIELIALYLILYFKIY